MKKVTNFHLLTLFLLILSTSFLSAQTTWNGGGGNTAWDNPLNWTAGVPDASDHVTIPGGATVVISTPALAKSVVNQGDLTIQINSSLTIDGSAGYGIDNYASVNNEGSINIDNTGNRAILNRTNSNFTNNNTLNIGQNGGPANITYDGIINYSVFNNNGNLTVDNVGEEGISNWIGGDFTNTGTIDIGQNGGSGNISRNGIANGYGGVANFTNSNGTINIDNTGNNGIINSNGTFTNSAIINIGKNAGSIGHSGIYQPGGSFTNDGGTIDIDNVVLSEGIHLAGSSFENKNNGQIFIGQVNGVGGHGLYTMNATFINNGSLIIIDNTGSTGITNNNGTFDNFAIINIGYNAGNIGSVGLSNQALGTFNNNAGFINIDNTGADGLYNDSGSFTNAATINIGLSGGAGSITANGLGNNSTFNNNSGGVINIDNTGSGGIFNNRTFTNKATINIGQNGGTGNIAQVGIGNGDIFINETGTINIDNTGNNGIVSVGIFTNQATLNIGQNGGAGNISNWGIEIVGSGSTFNNDAGMINIDNTGSNGVYNSNDGTFTNKAYIEIDNTGENGIYNLATFTNEATLNIGQNGGSGNINYFGIDNYASVNNEGSINIDNTGNRAILNRTNSNFTNNNTLNIGQNGGPANITYDGIINYSVFNNAGQLTIDNVGEEGLNNWIGGDFTNTGTIDIGQNGGSGNISRNGIANGYGGVANFTNTAGTINIDNTGQNAILNQSNLNNDNIINIGQNGGSGNINYYGIDNYASVNNEGSINIDNTGIRAILNRTNSNFTNNNAINIGQSGGPGNITYDGIINYSVFNNNGTLTIDNVGEEGINNWVGSDFTNTGTIDIGQNGGSGNISRNGIANGYGGVANFTNSNGTINIDNTGNNGILNRNGTFTNSAIINIGKNGGNIGHSGIYLPGGSFTNDGGTIDIDNTISFEGIYQSGGSTFENKNNGQVLIGQVGGVGRRGLYLGNATFMNDGGTITIDNTGSDGIENNAGTFTNSATINIGQNGGSGNIGAYGILNGATFNHSGGVVNVDNTANSALRNSTGTFTNSANLNIGQSGGPGNITYDGIINYSVFNNAGQLTIDNVGEVGIRNWAGGDFTSTGTINIGQNGGAGSILRDGIANGNGGIANFTNSNGTINIDNTGLSAFASFNSGLVQNLAGGQMNFGINTGNIGHHGIYNSGATFNNDASQINIANTLTQDGLENRSGGTFNNINGAVLNIGQVGGLGNVKAYGILNEAIFNHSGGEINIDNTANSAMRNSAGTFTNQATLNIGQNGGADNITGSGIDNSATFNNNGEGTILVSNTAISALNNGNAFNNLGCSSVRLFDDLNNASGTILNEGLFHINAADPSVAGNFTNNGVIEDIQGTLGAGVTNNALIVVPIAGGCMVMPALMAAGGNPFVPSANWFSDMAMSNLAGTYDAGNNKFTATNLSEGSHTLYFTASNGGCSFDLSIQFDYDDVIDPMIVCKNPTVELDANGNYTLTENDVFDASNSTNNCGTVSFVSMDITSVDCNDVWSSPVTVTVTVNDGNGNENTCTSLVTVEDNTLPVPTCKTTAVQLDATGNYALTQNDVYGGGTDNCTTVNFWKMTPAAVDCSQAGTTVPVLVEVFDASGNQAACTANVTVEDVEAPVAVCPANIPDVVLDGNGNGSLPANIGDGSSTDNCSATETSPAMTFNCSAGPQVVTLTVTDGFNTVTANCSFNVVDNQAPVAHCPANIPDVQLDASGNGSLPANIGDGSSTDNCSATETSPATNFTCADVGTQTVVLTASDGTNSSTINCSFNVVDNVLPAANCVSQTIQATLDANAQYTVDPNQLNENSTDACGIQSLAASPAVLDCQHEGTNTVTLTVTDNYGNTASCTATIEVAEFLTLDPPTATAESCAGAGDGTVSLTATAGGGQVKYSIDGGATYQASGTFGNLSPGTYTIVVKVFGVPAICEKTATATVAAGGSPTTWFKDMDGDGYTDGTTVTSCIKPTGYINNPLPGTDCNDNDPQAFPGQTWYEDLDGDGYGSGNTQNYCMRPAGCFTASELAATDTDCDDSEATVNPAAAEICDGLDNNCNGETDEGLSGTYVGNVFFTTQAQLDAWLACYDVIQGSVTIQGGNITDLTPLSNIVEITGNLTILMNSVLTSLDGLENLADVGGALYMYYNFQLSDCCAVSGLLDNGGVVGPILIFFNSVGCNSQAEIIGTCSPVPLVANGNGITQNYSSSIHVDFLQVFPNPASHEINIHFNRHAPQATLRITDMLGRVVFTKELSEGVDRTVIDLGNGNFKNGMYQVSLFENGETTTKQLVILR